MATPLTDGEIEAIADPWEKAAVLKAERARLRELLLEVRECLHAVRTDERSIAFGLWQGAYLWRHLSAVDLALYGVVQPGTWALLDLREQAAPVIEPCLDYSVQFFVCPDFSHYGR